MGKLTVSTVLSILLAITFLAGCQQPTGGTAELQGGEQIEINNKILDINNRAIELSGSGVNVELQVNSLAQDEMIGVTLLEGAMIENVTDNQDVFKESHIVPNKIFEIITQEGAGDCSFKIEVSSELNRADNQDIFYFDRLKQDWVAMNADYDSGLKSFTLAGQSAGVYCLAAKTESVDSTQNLKGRCPGGGKWVRKVVCITRPPCRCKRTKVPHPGRCRYISKYPSGPNQVCRVVLVWVSYKC